MESTLFEVESAFGLVRVSEKEGKRYLTLGKNNEQQSAYDQRWPEDPIFEYPRLMTPALALNPDSHNILLVGLGGGSLPRIFQMYRPDIKLSVVEINPTVIQVATEYFNFSAGGSVEIFEADGRVFLEQNPTRYDQIWLDAYNGCYIPEHLTTLEFLNLCKSRLKPKGVLVQNIHAGHPLYMAQQATLTDAFGYFYLVSGQQDNNAALISQKGIVRPRPAKQVFKEGIKIIGPRFGAINLRAEASKAKLSSHTDKMAVLHDSDLEK